MNFDEAMAEFGPPMVEPRADFRQAAAGNFEVFAAHVEAGFTRGEALTILLNLIAMGTRR